MKKIHNKSEMTVLQKENQRKILKGYITTAVACAMVASVLVFPCFADSEAEEAIDNLSEIIFGIIQAVGVIIAGWGVVQVGLSFQSHDPSQRSQGFLCLAGGLIVTFAKSILEAIAPGAF